MHRHAVLRIEPPAKAKAPAASCESRDTNSRLRVGQRSGRRKKIRTAGPDAPTDFEKDDMETKAEPGEKDEPGTRNVSEPRNLKRVSQHNMSYQTFDKTLEEVACGCFADAGRYPHRTAKPAVLSSR